MLHRVAFTVLKLAVLFAAARGTPVDYDNHDVPVPVAVPVPVRSQDARNSSRSDVSAWVDAASSIVSKIDCDNTSTNGIGGQKSECLLMKARPLSQMNVYAAESSAMYRLETILIDKYFKSNGAVHDGVLVIDPFPRSKLGHVLLVFFVDLNRNEKFCADIPKAVRATDGACVHQALRPKCRNVGRLGMGPFNCEITVLPLVVAHYTDHARLLLDRTKNFPVGQFQQLLKCQNAARFAACANQNAAVHSFKETLTNISEALKKCDFNAGKCAGISEIRSCKLFEVCDQAVLIGGGWNVDTVQFQQYLDIVAMHAFLTANGFAKENVHTFFGPGGSVSTASGELRKVQRVNSWRMQPASRKQALRTHFHNVCERNYCADVLLIYLNAPTIADGTMLLWDDGDGKLEEDEQYTKEEFFADISQCAANAVYIITDQRYELHIGEQFQRSALDQGKAILFMDTAEELEQNRTFTSRFLESLQNQPTRCITDNLYAITSADEDVTPIYQNVYGAPCSDDVTSLDRYKRCQAVPSQFWMPTDGPQDDQLDPDPDPEYVEPEMY